MRLKLFMTLLVVTVLFSGLSEFQRFGLSARLTSERAFSVIAARSALHLSFLSGDGVSDLSRAEVFCGGIREGERDDPFWRVWIPQISERYTSSFASGSYWTQTVSVPLWLPTVALTMLALRAWFKRETTSLLACKCGYVLTGVSGPVCPECGQARTRGQALGHGTQIE